MQQRDEHYVIDLCDRMIGVAASRQHRFPFLNGDPGKRGICRRLPVDAYYPALRLAVEYRERQHSEPVRDVAADEEVIRSELAVGAVRPLPAPTFYRLACGQIDT